MDGQSGTSGKRSVGRYSSKARNGGTGGQPGECNTAGAGHHGGVGAGWLAQGCGRGGSNDGERGGSRAQGWVGGRAGGMNSENNGGPPLGTVGGFGGGGGGSEDNRDLKILDAAALKNAVTSERAWVVTATFTWEK